MSTHERELTFIMLINRIQDVGKTFQVVTVRAIRDTAIPGKLTLMVVSMAISAPVMFNRIGELRFMAGFTVDCKMLIPERESCLFMVEIIQTTYVAE